MLSKIAEHLIMRLIDDLVQFCKLHFNHLHLRTASIADELFCLLAALEPIRVDVLPAGRYIAVCGLFFCFDGFRNRGGHVSVVIDG